MTAATKQALLRLSAEEKLRIIGELWDSLNESRIPELTAAQRAELERSVAEHELHPEEAVPLDQALAAMKRPRK